MLRSQKTNSTQAFIFADRETDAGAIVLAFRGTEAFNAYDWCTDLDFSWYELPQLVHLGFLEALGLGDRTRMQSFQRLKQNIYENSRTPLPQTPTSGLPDFVLSDETKLLAYDHISAELVTILRKHRNAKLYITGHSLGGALATLFTAMLFYNREENRVFYSTEDDVARRLAALYTFGQPRVGDKSFASFMDTSLNKPTMRYFRVVYNNDMVARVPFDNSLFGFKHFGNSCYFTYNYTPGTLLRDTALCVGSILTFYADPSGRAISQFLLPGLHGAVPALRAVRARPELLHEL
ncbi:uncharacterized protein LOC112346842 [Selaginella moellendorffii]|uniref:uncharacterized protein LOC112346842 n=1 Tax=Selaginella moellendorffii TaxID=88036 RepID=UPI000D1C4995|nr:uncharacterized protein LOC112346842 [Selaginella moellendorffii]|eukprot:XP_024532393.1 uncharacterized protein LOC112346842 [Selaginella moellendorffii]